MQNSPASFPTEVLHSSQRSQRHGPGRPPGSRNKRRKPNGEHVAGSYAAVLASLAATAIGGAKSAAAAAAGICKRRGGEE